MPLDSRRVTGAGLLVAAALAGAASLVLHWGTRPAGPDPAIDGGGAYGDPWFVLGHLGSFMGNDAADPFSNNPVVAIGAILLVAAVVFIAVAAVVAFTRSNRAFAIATTTDVLAFVGVGTYTLGLFLFTQQKQTASFPLDLGFWLAVAMLVLAFAAPVFLRAPIAPPAPPPVVGTPRVMRVTGPPAPPKRLKCPSCGNLEMVMPGTKPVCSKCGYGAPPAAEAAEPA